jgi:hypothetical protein
MIYKKQREYLILYVVYCLHPVILAKKKGYRRAANRGLYSPAPDASHLST